MKAKSLEEDEIESDKKPEQLRMSFEKRPVIEKIMLLRYGYLEAPRMAYPIRTIASIAKYLRIAYHRVFSLINKHYYIPRNGKKPI